MVDLRQTAAQIAGQYGIPVDLFLAQINQESGWNPAAVSSAGAIGLGQLMPGTAQELGVDPRDPVQNLTGAARYLSQQYKKFGDWRTALAAYNAGPGAVQKYGGIPPYKETQNYVQSIMGRLGSGADVAADTMAALGKGNKMDGMTPIAPQQRERKGFLGGLLSDPDLLDRLAIGFAGMTMNPNTGLQQVAAQRIASRAEERKAGRERNATAEWLRSQGRADLADGVMSGALPAATALQIAMDRPKDERTALMKNYEYARQTGYTGSFNDFLRAGGGGGSVVNVGGEMGKVVGDHIMVPDPNSEAGVRFIPIPGGKTATASEVAERVGEAKTAGAAASGATVLEDITRAKEIAKKNPFLATGFVGGILRGVGGTKAKTLDQLTTTIKANIGFDRLQRMRDESPTGGALGQVAVQELEALQSSLGSLDTSLDDAELLKNLERLEDQYRRSMQRILNTEGGSKYFTPREVEIIQSGGASASGQKPTHRFNPQTGQVEEIR